MKFFTIPARNDLPWYSFKISLSGVVYTLRFRFNTRMQRWIMDIADPSNNDILDGIPLLIGRDLSGQYVIDGLPVGISFCSDDTNQDTQPTRFSFGTDHSLVYGDPTQ